MNQIRILIVLCAGVLLWTTACTTDHYNNDILSNAIHAVDTNPQEALKLLESISPEHLYDSDKDQYMQFVVTLTQARYMDYQDITGDSLILDAQRYFARTRNYEMAARAGFYAAIYWHEGETIGKAVEYWQAAFDNAEKAGNDLFMAKCAYWLSISYFKQEQWEDAMPYCLKALDLYKNELNSELYQLGVTEMLGQIYRRQQDFKEAYLYFNNGLEMANKLNNTKYEARFLRNIGLIHRDKGEYRQAKEYFDLTLSIQTEPEDRMRTYLSYARLYRSMNIPDSTLHYLSTIENQVREITYPNTRRDIYAELVTYYKSNRGDGDKIARYSQLAHAEDLHIKKDLNEKKIDVINQQLKELKQKKQTEGRTYRRMFDYGLITVFLLASLLAGIWYSRRQLKEKYTQIKEKYGDTRNLQFTQTVDQLRLALDGLNSVAQGIDDLDQKELAYAGSPAWEQLLVLREKFSTQLAGYAKMKLEKMPNGATALSKLTPEDLSILQLSRFRVTNENIGWMLGYKGDTKEPVTLRKEQIRQVLTEAGMSQEEITKTFFILENH